MLRELLLKNVGWKLLSLALAVAIWLTVKGFSNDSGSQTERTFTDLPAQLVFGKADGQTFGINPSVVQVTVKGGPDIIKALTERDIRVYVDVSTADPARNSRQHVDVSTPTRVTIARVEPVEVEVVVNRTTKPDPQSKP